MTPYQWVAPAVLAAVTAFCIVLAAAPPVWRPPPPPRRKDGYEWR